MVADVSSGEGSGDLKKHHLATWQEKDGAGLPDEATANKFTTPLLEKYPQLIFKNPHERVKGNLIVNDSKEALRSTKLDAGCVRSSACRQIFWDPTKVKAAIVTCGYLCPGLNSMISGLTRTLWHDYGVEEILGMQSGFNGMSDIKRFPPVKLTPESVADIHQKGGSILKAGPGGFDKEMILNNLKELGVNMLFLVGGPGTLTAGTMLYEAARDRDQLLSMVTVPKSIDNDIEIFDRSFGYESAVVEASEIIKNGWVEASSCTKGVGIVKVMGRNAGYVAMTASMASDCADLCLIPEVTFKMEDVFAHVDAVIERSGYMVIAVAEGAGRDLVATDKKDAAGNTIYDDIGTHLRDAVNKYLKPKGGRSFYIDPSYIIRSAPVRPNDHIFCSRIATDAVHTAMRGYTGVCVGPVHDVMVMLPSSLIAGRSRTVNVKRSAWQQCVQTCQMPCSLSGLQASPEAEGK